MTNFIITKYNFQGDIYIIMKSKTLLKVLSASAIFTAIAAIESYDYNAFATEVAATATDNQSDVETKTVPQDYQTVHTI